MISFIQTQALVLKRRDHKEDDRFITFYTKDYGKISAIAVSARKAKSKLAGHLEPLTLIDAHIVSKRQQKIIGASGINHYHNIFSSFERLEIAGECARLVDELTRESIPEPKIFELLGNTLETLDGQQSFGKEFFIKPIFIFQLLDILGYRPEVRRCVVSRKAIDGQEVMFSPEKGGIVLKEFSKSFHDIKVSQVTIEMINKSLSQSFEECIDASSATDHAEFENITNSFLAFRR